MRARDEQLFDEIAFLAVPANHALAAAALLAVGRHGRTFDVPLVRQGHDHVFFRDQVFNINIIGGGDDLRPPVVAVLVVHLVDVFANHVHQQLVVAEDRFVALDLFDQRTVIASEFFDFQPRQSTQLHTQNRVGLHAGQLLIAAGDCDKTLGQQFANRRFFGQLQVQCHQARLGRRFVRTRLDQVDDPVDVRHREDQPFQQVGPLTRSTKQKLRPSRDHIFAMFQEIIEHITKRQCPRGAVHQRDVDNAERRLQRREFVELVDDDVGFGALFEVHHNPHARAVGVILHVGDVRDPSFLHALGDVLDDRRLEHLIRNLRNDDLFSSAADLLGMQLPPDLHSASACAVAFANARSPADHSTGREVRAWNNFQQIVRRGFGVFD